ncbi:MAG TPA: ATP-binding protein [Gemmatimonadaceae bacterium]|nr:ATP-binding protein [Gemmatimonadaceae bacterium]
MREVIPGAEPGNARNRRSERPVSLRTELLVNLATLATAALLLAITTIVLFDTVLSSLSGVLLLTGLVTADVVVFLLFGYHLTGRLVLQPLDVVVRAADEIAQGERVRRVPEQGAPEFVRLARSINTMTDQLIAEQERMLRVEKMASLGRLAAGVAHEVGNPLGAINGYTHLLTRRMGADPEALGMLRDLGREAARVDRIMRGLLDYARPRRIAASLVPVAESVSRVVAFLKDQGALAHMKVETVFEAEVPPVRVDSHALDQVLVNLILNAAQATPVKGSVTIRVRRTALDPAIGRGSRRANDPGDAPMPRSAALRVIAWREGGMPAELIEVLVSDSGPGIPEADLERVFDPFFTTRDPGEGTGLGLAIVSRTVEDAGGIVFARRAREGGAAFVVLLPAAEREQARVPRTREGAAS